MVRRQGLKKVAQHSSLKPVATEVEGASHAVTSSEDITHLNEKRRWTGVIRWVRRIALGLRLRQGVSVRGSRYGAHRPGDTR
jgi:hypothetical protein